MAEYISREEAIKGLREVYEYEYPTASGDFDEYASHDVPNVLRNIPAADVQSVKRGKWEDTISCFIDKLGAYYITSKCSQCSEWSDKIDEVAHMSNEYCSHCGADMRGDTE